MPVKKGTHLNFDDRCEIEEMLKDGCSFREIARKLDVSPTTISTEVRQNRTIFPSLDPEEQLGQEASITPKKQPVPRSRPRTIQLSLEDITCGDQKTTENPFWSQSPSSKTLNTYEQLHLFKQDSAEKDTINPIPAGKESSNRKPQPDKIQASKAFTPIENPKNSPSTQPPQSSQLSQSQPSCKRREQAPFVCSNCPDRTHCRQSKARYIASKAQAAHDERLSAAHKGIACDAEELKTMVAKVKSLLAKGQSIQAIWTTHAGEFPVCERTFYNYIERGVAGLTNLDLPKKVKYSPRAPVQAQENVNPQEDAQTAYTLTRAATSPYESSPNIIGTTTEQDRIPIYESSLVGRRYSDWKRLPASQRLLTVQMDTVEGCQGNHQCILSLHFIRFFFQLYILLEEKTRECVKKALDAIEYYCDGSFKPTFSILLTDRGVEFDDYDAIERSINGSRRTRVFYCDPDKPSQKGAAEKNHVELRKILPKGTDFDLLTKEEVAIIASHVNSYPRASSRQAPILHAMVELPQTLLDYLKLEVIEPDEVIMTPALLTRIREKKTRKGSVEATSAESYS